MHFPRTAVLIALLSVLPASGCLSFNHFTVFPFGKKEPLQAFSIGGDEDSRSLAVVVDVQGILFDVEERGLLGLTGIKNTVAHVRAVLRKIEDERDVRGVVLRINSPGGTVTASDLIYHEIAAYRSRHPDVPVYTLMMDLAASGGYYAAMASDRIWAHPTTVTGSIGVIVQGINLAGLFRKIGIEDSTIKSGKFKDTLSPLRPQTEEDRKLMQAVVDDLYRKFLDRVRSGRPAIAAGRLQELADGRIYTASQAKAEGLIDEIGYFDDMLSALAKDAGVRSLHAVMFRNEAETDDNIYVAQRPSTADPLAGGSAAAILAGLLPGPSPFLYLWPGALGRGY